MTEPTHGPTAGLTTNDLPLEISYDEIRNAYHRGDAAPLSDVITDIVRYRDHWWIAHTYTWLLITDDATVSKLDRHAEWANPKLLRDPQ